MTVNGQSVLAPARPPVTPPVTPAGTSVALDEPDALREVFGCFATGVAVVTATGPEGPAGMTVSAYTSLSIRPSLVLFCAADESTTWPRISRCGSFVINILAHGQEDLAGAFARGHAHRFAGVRPSLSPAGLPVLPGILAYLECRIEQRWRGGDHTVVVGLVRHAERLREDAPLLHFRGRLR
ncbi:MAG TPA: flavin reductase family protein [Streptosporangiaceae bacterium]|nr:flavin reductase family protein [Streptosporangiaceae bacterium]